MIDNRLLEDMPNFVCLFYRKLKNKGENALADTYLDMHLQMEIADRHRKMCMYDTDEWRKFDWQVRRLKTDIYWMERYSQE